MMVLLKESNMGRPNMPQISTAGFVSALTSSGYRVFDEQAVGNQASTLAALRDKEAARRLGVSSNVDVIIPGTVGTTPRGEFEGFHGADANADIRAVDVATGRVLMTCNDATQGSSMNDFGAGVDALKKLVTKVTSPFVLLRSRRRG